MSLIGIPLLCEIESSCNSNTTGASLKGTLYIVTKEIEFKRGTVHLVDKSTKASLPCVMDRFFPRFHKKTVIIKRWNYIYDKPSGYRFIEFETDHAYEKHAELSILRDHFTKENELFRVLRKSVTFDTPNPHCNTDVVGKVRSISTLTFQPDTTIWFLEISDVEDHVSIIIQFNGDELIPYHSYFQIGSIYTFQKLTQANCADYHFVYTDISTCCTITLKQYTDKLKKIQHPYPPNEDTASVTSYAGCITRVIDSLFGIYELDGRIILCLFHYQGYSPAQPYRIHTRLLLHHFHGTVLQGSNSHLLKSWKMGPDCPVMVTCKKTHIQLVEFPTHCDISVENVETITYKLAVYVELVQEPWTFSQLVRQLELYTTLVDKFDCPWTSREFKDIWSVIRNYVFDTPEPEPPTGWMLDFVYHDRDCSTMGHDPRVHIPLDDYPGLNKIKADLQARLQPYEVDVVGGNNLYEEEKVDIRYADYVQSDNVYFLGLVTTKKDGRVIIMDREGEIELATATRLELGGVYIIRQVRMFEEDLSFKHAYTGQVSEIKPVYLTCDSQDLCLVHRPPAPRFQIQEVFDPYQTVGFHCSNSQLESYSVVRILEIYPIQTVLYEGGVFHMESRMLVEVYRWGEKKQTTRHLLVASSQTNTLKHCKSLHTDDWCVISGLNRDQNKTYLDNQYVFPILIQTTRIPSATLIVPLQGKWKQKDRSRNILTVSQIMVDKLAPDSGYLDRLYQFYKLPVNVRGIVISKKILNGFGRASVLGPQSKRLFEEHGIGTGKCDRNIQIQLRQLDSLEYVTVYLSPSKWHYPLGLVPGATVTIRNMIRRTSAGENKITGASIDTSMIHVETTRHVQNVRLNTETELKVRELIQGKDVGDIFKTYCSVNSIIYMELKWKCKQCGSVILRNQCYDMCENAKRLFIASAFAEVSDGYGNIDASMDGERLVFDFLKLNKREKEGVKRIAAEYGQIKYSKSKRSVVESMDPTSAFIAKQREIIGCDLDTLFRKTKTTGDIWIHGKIVETKKRLAEEDKGKNAGFANVHLASLTENGKVIDYYELDKKKIKVYHVEKADKKAYWYGELRKAMDRV